MKGHNGWIIIAFGTCLVTCTVFGQQTNQQSNLQWHDARDLRIEGKGWSDTKQFYDRLPARAQGKVRTNVWNLSRDSAGICARFVTDATTITARWTLRKEQLAMPHMSACGVSGLDLYVKEKGKWQWLGSGRPDKSPTNEKVLVKDLRREQREYLLYFPLYNGVDEVKIGVPSETRFEPAPARRDGVKSIVFYGTSILQGACASRPGMAYPAILGRRLDWPTINLGFSGNAWSEPEVAALLAELDPAVYVLDPLPNMTPDAVAKRIEPFVAMLRQAHPKTPIVLVEHIEYPDGKFVALRFDRYSQSNVRLQEIYTRLVKAGDKHLHYVNAEKLIGNDGEATVDGTHPTDLGFMRMADSMTPLLRRLAKAR